MKKNNKFLISTCITTILPMIIGFFLYNKLPVAIPSHYSINGSLDGYLNKNVVIFVLPIIFLICHLICTLSILLDPKYKNNEISNKKIHTLLFLVCPILSNALINISFFNALGNNINQFFLIQLLTSILIIVLGNYIPKCKQNYSVGYKLPWTLENEHIWNKTHLLAGWLWLFGGVILFINSFFYNAIIFILTMIIIFIIPCIYAYILYNKINNN